MAAVLWQVSTCTYAITWDSCTKIEALNNSYALKVYKLMTPKEREMYARVESGMYEYDVKHKLPCPLISESLYDFFFILKQEEGQKGANH